MQEAIKELQKTSIAWAWSQKMHELKSKISDSNGVDSVAYANASLLADAWGEAWSAELAELKAKQNEAIDSDAEIAEVLDNSRIALEEYHKLQSI